MSTLELDQQLNTLIIEGKSMDAFRRFYAEDVVSQENDEPERVGRDAWMRARQELENKMKKFNARVLSHAANGDISFSEWEYDVEIEGDGCDEGQPSCGPPLERWASPPRTALPQVGCWGGWE